MAEVTRSPSTYMVNNMFSGFNAPVRRCSKWLVRVQSSGSRRQGYGPLGDINVSLEVTIFMRKWPSDAGPAWPMCCQGNVL